VTAAGRGPGAGDADPGDVPAGPDAPGADPDGALFELEGVTLDIEGRTVLNGVTLRVPDQGITVVVGPSGSGKSTVLRLLNRLEVPSSGEIRFRGTPIASLDPLVLRRRVGMVFQRPTPFPGTGRDNLLVADPAASDDQLTGALAAAGLDPGFLDRSADELSGGETQRLCLARTLVTEPEVLLMDEPTSALDAESRDRLEATARRLAAGGRPVVWVTHDLGQCQRLADRSVVLLDGRVADDDAGTRYLADQRGSPSAGRSPAAAAPEGSGNATGPGRLGVGRPEATSREEPGGG
jgi:putative ABC transport system ATP-binding protein